jgi:hypothetical protein
VLGEGSLKIMAANAEQEEAQEEIEVEYDGEHSTSVSMSAYLLDVLNNSSGESDRMGLQRRQFECAVDHSGQRAIQVRRNADAHLSRSAQTFRSSCRC